MPARREAEYAYALRVNPPLGAAAAAGGVAGSRVLQGCRVVVTRAEPVLEDEGRDADCVQPLGDGPALVVCEVRVSAAGADDDRRARRLLLRRQVGRERRHVNRLSAQSARRTIRPEWKRLVRGRRARE